MGRRFIRLEVLSIVSDANRVFAVWGDVRNSGLANTYIVGLPTIEKIRLYRRCQC